MNTSQEPDRWLDVKKQMGEKMLVLGPELASFYYQAPRQILYFMTRYKLAAKLIGPGKQVLDVGCREGLGTYLLGVESGLAQGIDANAGAIASAQGNFGHDKRVRFAQGDFASWPVQEWDAVVNLSGTENFASWGRLKENLKHDGLSILGTSKSPDSLQKEMRPHFHHVFLFSLTEEVILAGHIPNAQYWIGLGCRKK
jgi:SAM-dependent methyltransferase